MSAATGPLTTRHRDGKIIDVPLAASTQVYKGAAAAVALGVGNGTPLVPANVLHQFIGVWAASVLSASSGTTYAPVVRRGIFAFNQTGTTITTANLGEPAYFSDDNTVTLTEGTTYAGVICYVDAAGNVWVDIEQAIRQSPNVGRNVLALSGTTDAINAHSEGNYAITGAAIDAMTLAAPTAGTDDGTKITLLSTSAYAHTLTATGLLQTGATAVNVATFAAHAGASLTLVAYNAKWVVLAANAITFS